MTADAANAEVPTCLYCGHEGSLGDGLYTTYGSEIEDADPGDKFECRFPSDCRERCVQQLSALRREVIKVRCDRVKEIAALRAIVSLVAEAYRPSLENDNDDELCPFAPMLTVGQVRKAAALLATPKSQGEGE